MAISSVSGWRWGARGSHLLRWILGRGFLLVGLGWIVGRALAATRLIRQLLFETDATDPVSFAVVSEFLALVAPWASLIPVWRAVRVNPVSALIRFFRREGVDFAALAPVRLTRLRIPKRVMPDHAD